MPNEGEIAQIANELQVQQAKGEAIRKQMEAMQTSLMELGSAIDAVNNIKKAKGDTLVPLGSGVYLSCPKLAVDRVIINIGANVMIQKKPDEAVKILETRQKKLNSIIKAMQEDLGLVVQAIEGLNKRASTIAAMGERENVQSPKE